MNKRISGYRQSETMQGTISARTPESPVLQCLLFLGVFLVAMLVESAPPTMLAFPYMMAQLLISHVDLSDSAAVMAFSTSFTLPGWLVAMQLFCTGLATLLTVVYCTDVERRPLRSLGFARKNALRDYLTGAALGVGMIGGAVLVGVSTGSLEYAGSSLRGNGGVFFLLLLGWMVQGMSEEVMFRGFFCNSLVRKCNPHVAALISGIAFALAHMANNGKTLLAIPNLILFGMFAAYYMYRFDSLWGICALHSFWNFAQGNLFGIKVSGMSLDVTALRFVSKEGRELIHGGLFGLEGGVGVTIMLLIGIGLLLFTGEQAEKRKV
ncbi:lysostaphin resistance A-like protein [Ruminococcus champanellensis]|uniref:CPBP family intramembrane glutamic endopeptidase n=1 Tax=Ruminococcus champanellensis TaxID=1161942 RepID=UPI0039F561B2